jgi:hypothetical protein
MEDVIIMEYVRWADDTEVCTSPQGVKYYYMDRDLGYTLDYCEAMPQIVDIRCIANCSKDAVVCYIEHADGYVAEDRRKFGEERVFE